MPKLIEHEVDHLEDAYGVILPEKKYPPLKRLKKKHEPSAHGHKTWDSSFNVMDYLLHNPMKRGARVLEIGCGWGPVSVFCAKRFKAKVTGLDIDPAVFPFLDLVADLNDVKIRHLVSNYKKLTDAQLAEYDVIIGSDVCFWDKLVKPLADLSVRALDAGVKRVIIADPGRPTFYSMVDRVRKRARVSLQDWYAMDPDFFQGDIAEFRAR
ncbi:MAG: methyltransferase domain-containing protein [Pseudomonadota bacterium]